MSNTPLAEDRPAPARLNAADTGDEPSTAAARPGLPWRQLAVWAAGIALPVVLIGGGPFIRLVKLWLDDIEYSHGLFVVPMSVYFVWLRRAELARIRARPSWLGVPILAFGILGSVVTALSPSPFRANFALLLMVVGLVLALNGWARTRAIGLPLLFLFFMLPLPGHFRTQVAVPLQLFAAKAGAMLLRLLGVPVYAEGAWIELPGQSMEVGEACSGINLLMGFLALGFVFAYLSRRRTWFRAVLFASTVPIALLVNIVRVAGTGLIRAYLTPRLAEGFLHLFEGYMLFVAGIAFFFLAQRLLLLLANSLEIATTVEPKPQLAGEAGAGLEAPAGAGVCLVVCAVLLYAGAGAYTMASRYGPDDRARPELARIPTLLGAEPPWKGFDVPLRDSDIRLSGADAHIHRSYVAPGGQPVVLYVSYYAAPYNDLPHDPEICNGTGGWIKVGETRADFAADGNTLLATNLVFRKKTGEQLALQHWYVDTGRPARSCKGWKLLYVLDVLRGRRPWVVQVQVSRELRMHATVDGASQDFEAFSRLLWPELRKQLAAARGSGAHNMEDTRR